MAALGRIYVFTSTSGKTNADNDTGMSLVYTSQSGAEEEFRLGGQPWNEREKGRTDLYVFDVNAGDEIEDIEDDQFRIVALGDDAWLPSSIFIIGQANQDFRVLVGRDEWPDDAWFSTDLSDVGGKASKARLLDRQATPTLG